MVSNNTKRITLAVLAEKIDNLSELVRQHTIDDRQQFEHVWRLLEGPEGQPGLKGRLDRLEVSESKRTRHIYALWGTFASTVAAWIVAKF